MMQTLDYRSGGSGQPSFYAEAGAGAGSSCEQHGRWGGPASPVAPSATSRSNTAPCSVVAIAASVRLGKPTQPGFPDPSQSLPRALLQ